VALRREVRFAPVNGHRQLGGACLKSAITRNPSEARCSYSYAKGGRAPVEWHIMISMRSKVMACRKSFALLAK
jgi:hypothetical protein